MHSGSERIAHCTSTDVCNGMKSQAIVELIVVLEILSYAIDDKVDELMLFVEKQRDRQISYLLLREFGGGYEVDSFEVTEIKVPAQDVDVK